MTIKSLPDTEIAAGKLDAAASEGGARHSIWLVDDDAMTRELCAEMLWMDGGFDCTRQFDSAEAVIAALRQTPGPELMLLDVNMPGMSGARAVKFIKSLSPDTHVFMFSTFIDTLCAAEAKAGGASGFLRKCHPFDWILKTLRLEVDSLAVTQPDTA